MNKKFLNLLIFPTLLITLGSCSKPVDDPIIPVNFGEAINLLKKGFKADAKITTTKNYFVDKDHLTAADIPSVTSNYQSIFTYTDKEDYVGMDYKYYKLNEDKKVYLDGDNFYKFDITFGNNDEPSSLDTVKSVIGFNYIDYDNTLRSDSYATDDNMNVFSYASSGLLNPFKFVKENNFTQEGRLSTLDRGTTNIVFSYLFSQIVDIPANINIESNIFTFKDDKVLEQAKFTSFPYNLTETISAVNYYPQITYDFVIDFTEVGTANAKTEIAPEPEKLENVPLKHALENLINTKNYRFRRHYKAVDGDEPIENEEAIDVYFDGIHKEVYQSCFQYQEGFPEDATEADAYYIDTNGDKKLNAYMYQPSSDGSFKFQKTNLLPDVDNVFTYEDFTLQNLSLIDANTFNINDDGSYSPIQSNLAYIASDCFVPMIATTSEIAGGFVDDFKLYLKDENIDKIVLKTSYYGVYATITLTFDLFNQANIIPFDARTNIIK